MTLANDTYNPRMRVNNQQLMKFQTLFSRGPAFYVGCSNSKQEQLQDRLIFPLYGFSKCCKIVKS